jgi:hypothetical protein
LHTFFSEAAATFLCLWAAFYGRLCHDSSVYFSSSHFLSKKILSFQKVGHTQMHNLHRVVFEGKLEKVVETNKVTV